MSAIRYGTGVLGIGLGELVILAVICAAVLVPIVGLGVVLMLSRKRRR